MCGATVFTHSLAIVYCIDRLCKIVVTYLVQTHISGVATLHFDVQRSQVEPCHHLLLTPLLSNCLALFKAESPNLPTWWSNSPYWAWAFSLPSPSRSYFRHTTNGKTPGRMISTVPDVTQHSQETESSVLGEIRTRSPKKASGGRDRLGLPTDIFVDEPSVLDDVTWNWTMMYFEGTVWTCIQYIGECWRHLPQGCETS